MVFHVCDSCKDKGVIPIYDALLNMKTLDGVQLCALCEQRIDGCHYSKINVRVRRVARDVYGVLPLIEPFLNLLSQEEAGETQKFYHDKR